MFFEQETLLKNAIKRALNWILYLKVYSITALLNKILQNIDKSVQMIRLAFKS